MHRHKGVQVAVVVPFTGSATKTSFSYVTIIVGSVGTWDYALHFKAQQTRRERIERNEREVSERAWMSGDA